MLTVQKGSSLFLSTAPGYLGRDFTVATHDAVDAIGYADGDHSDPGVRAPGTNPARAEPGTESRRLGRAHWIPDHQPPNEVAMVSGTAIRFYPHSWPSARRQGGAVRAYIAAMTEKLGRPLAQWGREIRSAWFW